MADPILTAAELIAFLEGQCKQADSDRDDWKLMTERLQRVINHHENVGTELRARIAQQSMLIDDIQAENQRLRVQLECPAPIDGISSAAECIATGRCGCNASACAMRTEMQRLRADADRLHWLCENAEDEQAGCRFFEWNHVASLRSAIDAARSK